MNIARIYDILLNFNSLLPFLYDLLRHSLFAANSIGLDFCCTLSLLSACVFVFRAVHTTVVSVIAFPTDMNAFMRRLILHESP